MSKGIYLLRFKGTDKVYIGQSLNIEYRYRDHLNPANRSQKLAEAFILYGNPTLEILCEATDDELNDLENEAIQIFNAVDEGFNTRYTAGGKTSLYGDKLYNSIYTNEQIEEAFLLLVGNSELLLKEVSSITGIPIETVGHISSCLGHTWLAKKYPLEYQEIKNRKYSKQDGSKNNMSTVSNDKVEELLLYLVANPKTSLIKISEVLNISISIVRHVASGDRHKWLQRKYPIEYAKLINLKGTRSTVETPPKVLSPEGVVMEVLPSIKGFARANKLPQSGFGDLVRKYRGEYKGWRLVS